MKKIITLSVLAVSLCALPAGASGTDNPFANLPKASDYLGSPEAFVREVEGRVNPVLIQFFSGVAAVYSMAQLIKAMKGAK